MGDIYTIDIVSYVNSKPFLNGIMASPFLQKNGLIHQGVPGKVSASLLNKNCNIALAPIACLLDLDSEKFEILTDYCISADGQVYSVALFSQVPIHELDLILLDSESRTSNLLTKILLAFHWKLDIPLVTSIDDDFEGTIGRVIIGDKAFGLEEKYSFKYDLSEEWKKFTGLPFVFACWVGVGNIDNDFSNALNEALKAGLDTRENIVLEYPIEERAQMRKYLFNYIQYEFNSSKRNSITTYMNLAKSLEEE